MSELDRKSKFWTFTINNYTDEDYTQVCGLQEDSDYSYIVCGKEIGDDRQTPHLQGYLELSSRKRGAWLKRRLGSEGTNPHLEARKGSAIQASDYCKKEGTYFEYGTLSPPSAQGTRNDLEDIKNAIDEGASPADICESHFSQWVYHRRAFEEYRAMSAEARTWVPEVHVLWGATGTGKTRYVYDKEKEHLWIASDNQLNWFNGYHGQDAVLFDDFVGCKNNKFGFLLRLLDRYPMKVPTKGGFVNWKPRRIYITSNIEPRSWFFGVTQEQQDALRRRMTNVTHFGMLP